MFDAPTEALDTYFTFPEFFDQAACAGLDDSYFFLPEEQTDLRREQDLPGLAICRTCSVAAECMEFALRNRIDYGVFGGKTSRERKAIRRKRDRYALSVIP